MNPLTQQLWTEQDQHRGDRYRLFTAIASVVNGEADLYPGSFVDIAPSFVFRAVTYVDQDDRTAQFFADVDGVDELIEAHGRDRADTNVEFLQRDYRTDIGVEREYFDLLVSLSAGFVSEHCTDYLRVGGTLLVNPSHGDAAMASIDSRYRLSAVVESRSGDYRVMTTSLDDHLVSKRDGEVTVELLHRTGRGIGYTKSPFAYLFTSIV